METFFTSPLKDEFTAFVALKESVIKDRWAYRHDLLSLDSLLVREGLDEKRLDRKMVELWTKSLTHLAPATVRITIGRIRLFARYLQSLGIFADIPELPKGTSLYVPHIFNDDEITAIFAAVDDLSLSMPKSPAAVELPVFLRMLYGCGLRAGEASALRWSDIDLDEGVICVRKAKNNTQRLVPMAEELTRILRLYRDAPDMAMSKDDFLFRSKDGEHRPPDTFNNVFGELLKTLRIKPPRPQRAHSRGPCLHCMRHVFVLKSLLKSEAEGRPFIESVPSLSTYLGHRNPMGTDKYLNACHELYADAHEAVSAYTFDVFPEEEA
ncbi:MAG: tyrosine-type recombinase/integrase [Coriobacteriales bacterium]|jgi:integrase|nr:tyrosine-type recombinase/integrase [Coriobacteriales bacterium]